VLEDQVTVPAVEVRDRSLRLRHRVDVGPAGIRVVFFDEHEFVPVVARDLVDHEPLRNLDDAADPLHLAQVDDITIDGIAQIAQVECSRASVIMFANPVPLDQHAAARQAVNQVRLRNLSEITLELRALLVAFSTVAGSDPPHEAEHSVALHGRTRNHDVVPVALPELIADQVDEAHGLLDLLSQEDGDPFTEPTQDLGQIAVCNLTPRNPIATSANPSSEPCDLPSFVRRDHDTACLIGPISVAEDALNLTTLSGVEIPVAPEDTSLAVEGGDRVGDILTVRRVVEVGDAHLRPGRVDDATDPLTACNRPLHDLLVAIRLDATRGHAPVRRDRDIRQPFPGHFLRDRDVGRTRGGLTQQSEAGGLTALTRRVVVTSIEHQVPELGPDIRCHVSRTFYTQCTT